VRGAGCRGGRGSTRARGWPQVTSAPPLAVRMSPFAELVTIEIVKVALTEAVA